MSGSNIRVELDGSIATLTISNPGKRNALSRQSWIDLSAEVARLNEAENLRCVIVRGEGTEAFAAGADISEFPKYRSNAEQAVAYGEHVGQALEALATCLHPTIAMIHGACTGGGMEIACCCDMRIAGTSARFGAPINRLGHGFAAAEMEPVLNVVGPAVLLEILFEGQLFTAEEAFLRGIVNRVVADELLQENVYATAGRIAEGAPLAARMTKKILRRLKNPEPLNAEELLASYAPCDSEDYAEGVRAFLAKEKPEFKGC